jgi:Tfp pilus assembly protein PilN
MLRTNLATRPFYNERLAAILVALLALVVAVVTIVNVVTFIRLTTRQAALGSQASKQETRATELRRQAQQAQAAVDREWLTSVARASHEANAVIDRRTFSWTELFNRFEATLPDEVRITSVAPARDDRGRFVVTIGVVSRTIADVETFMDALESRGGFEHVLARQDQVDDDGMVESVISGVYLPPAAQASAGGQP